MLHANVNIRVAVFSSGTVAAPEDPESRDHRRLSVQADVYLIKLVVHDVRARLDQSKVGRPIYDDPASIGEHEILTQMSREPRGIRSQESLYVGFIETANRHLVLRHVASS